MRQQFNEYLQKFKEAIPDEIQNKMKKAIEELEASDDAEGQKD